MEGRVSQSFVEKTADCEYKLSNGVIVPLRDEKGDIKIDLVLYLLGFHYDFHTGQANYKLLTKDVKYNRVYDSTSVFVRSDTSPHLVREMKVYCGKIREDYLHKGIYAEDKILTVEFDTKDTLDINSIGSKEEYDKGYNRMKDVGESGTFKGIGEAIEESRMD